MSSQLDDPMGADDASERVSESDDKKHDSGQGLMLQDVRMDVVPSVQDPVGMRGPAIDNTSRTSESGFTAV